MTKQGRETDSHLHDHPEALLLDQDDKYVVGLFKFEKDTLKRNARFVRAVARVCES